MVIKSYQEISEQYEIIKEKTCGRQACSVMILVACEVDAMASARMLTQLLREDNIAYTMRPVANNSQLVDSAAESHRTGDIKVVIMINCGAMHNIPKTFGLERGGDMRCFVMDYHRPFHLANVHSRQNVVIFEDLDGDGRGGVADQDIPEDGSLISEHGIDSEDDDDDEESEDEDGAAEEEDLYSDLDEEDGAGKEGVEEEEEADFGGDGEANEEAQGDGDADPENDKIEEEDGDGEGDRDGGDVTDVGKHGEGGELEGGEESGVKRRLKEDSKGDGDDEVEVEKDEEGKEKLFSSPSQGMKKKKRRRKDRTGEDGEDGEDDGEGEEDEEGDGEGEGEGEGDEEGDEDSEDVFDMNKLNQGRGGDDAGDGEDGEMEEKVVGRRRRDLAAKYDPIKQRRKQLKSYYFKTYAPSPPTSLLLINLVGRKSNSTPLEPLWQAVLGVTDQYFRYRISEDAYSLYCGVLRGLLENHLASASERASYTVGEDDQKVVVPGAETGHIVEGPDYRFFLYRHWSLIDSMIHSPYIATKLNVCRAQGVSKLKELLAKIGVPLQQGTQSYNFVPPSLRSHLRAELTKDATKQEYNLHSPDIMFRSFYRYNSFKNPIASCDVVSAANALAELGGGLESSGSVSGGSGGNRLAPQPRSQHPNSTSTASAMEAFNEAYDCLGMRNDDLLKKGILNALHVQRALVKKATVLLEGGAELLAPGNRFYYAYLNGGSSGDVASGHNSFANPSSLSSILISSNGNTAATTTSSGGNLEGELESIFTRPFVLERLGHFIMDVKRGMSKRDDGWVGKRLLPLILVSFKRDTALIVGINPLDSMHGREGVSEEHLRECHVLSNFKYYFGLAAQELKISIRNDFFDANVIEIAAGDAHDFVGTLDFLLKKAVTRLSA